MGSARGVCVFLGPGQGRGGRMVSTYLPIYLYLTSENDTYVLDCGRSEQSWGTKKLGREFYGLFA